MLATGSNVNAHVPTTFLAIFLLERHLHIPGIWRHKGIRLLPVVSNTSRHDVSGGIKAIASWAVGRRLLIERNLPGLEKRFPFHHLALERLHDLFLRGREPLGRP